MIKTFEKKEEAKLEEGNIKTIDNEQEVEDITVAVNTEVPDEVAKIEKDDKQAFEEFKEMYKGVIDIKCRQDFGDCEDEKLWEDTAKELFLQSKNYILVGDEYKAKEDLDDHLEKIEESKEIITEDIDEGNSIFEMKFDCSNTDVFGEGEDLYNTVGAKVAEIAEKIKSGRLDGAIMDINGNKIGSYGVGYEGVMSALDESKEVITEARENDIETRINTVKEWKQKVEDAVEAEDLEAIVDDILEFAEDIKDINFAGEDLYSGMSSVLDNGDAEARGPVTYVRSVKRDMQNILDDFIDNYEQAFEEESLEESKVEEAIVGKNEYTDEDEAAYYRNKELYAHSCLARHRDAMEKAREACIKKGIKLESKTFTEEDIEKTIKEYLVKTNGIFTDDSIYDIVEELCGESDIEKMPKDLVDQVTAKVYKDNKIEEKRTLSQAEIDQLRKNMRQVLKDHGKFDNDEELEDYIEEFMPMWIEAQENLGEPVILDESDNEEFKNKYSKSFKVWKEANPNKSDEEIIAILKAKQYNGELKESEQKEIKTEDQYEMERRKGRPNLNEIAKELFEYDDYYIDVVDNFRSEREFIIEHIAEVAAEYNLKEQAAWAVMEKIYKMAKEAKSKDDKVEEAKSITDAEIAELDKFIDDLENEYPTPKEGASDTEIGEWRRCWNNLAYAFYNNGDKAGVGFENGQEKKFDELYAASKPFGNELARLVDTIYGTRNETTYQNKLYRALIKFREIVEAKLKESNKVEESNVSDYTLAELNNVLQNAKEDGLGFTLQIMSRDNTDKTKHLNIDIEDFRAIYSALEGLKK